MHPKAALILITFVGIGYILFSQIPYFWKDSEMFPDIIYLVNAIFLTILSIVICILSKFEKVKRAAFLLLGVMIIFLISYIVVLCN